MQKKPITEQEALNKAAAYCSTCERCMSEVRTKLAAWGMNSAQAERITERLVDEGFIDERRYSRAFVNDKVKFNRWGRIKITAALRMKQLSSGDISEAIAQIDEEEYRNALASLIAVKRREVGDDKEGEKKLLRFAMSRGFEPSLVIQMLKCDPYEMDF